MAKDFDRYGWAVNEENLSTLPPSAPQGAKDLAKFLTLDGRRKALESWLAEVQDDGRIHGKFWNIGAWSGRMSHSSPNMANISACWPVDKAGVKVPPKTAVEEVKYTYDTTLRSLWETDHWLVGTDAEGIQLRILAHYMGDAKFTEALHTGDKSLGTDAHTMNMKKLGPVCKDRDTAKTYVYAFLLGASATKLAEVLSCSVNEAKKATHMFIEGYPGLKKLKNVIIPRDAHKGYFIGLDGRKVECDSEHHMLAGYLQNGESVVMKWANRLWRQRLDEEIVWYRQVNFVHDEWQTEAASKEMAEYIGEVQRWSIEQAGIDLGVKCPLAGSSVIGKDWSQTH